MKEFLFYIEGINREMWVQGETEKIAHAGAWNSFSEEEKDAVVQIECIDERDITEAD